MRCASFASVCANASFGGVARTPFTVKRSVANAAPAEAMWRMPRLLRRPGLLRTSQYGVENASRSPMWRGERSALALGSARKIELLIGYHTGYENDVEHSGRARNGYGLWR